MSLYSLFVLFLAVGWFMGVLHAWDARAMLVAYGLAAAAVIVLVIGANTPDADFDAVRFVVEVVGFGVGYVSGRSMYSKAMEEHHGR